MPIAVQLPGYRQGQVGLGDVLNLINNFQTGSAQRAELAEKTKGEQLANQQAQIQANAQQGQMKLLDPSASQESVDDGQGNQVPNPNYNPKAKAVDDMLHAGLNSKIAEVLGVVPQGTFDPVINASKQLHGLDLMRAMPDLTSAVELQKAKYSGGAAAARVKVQEENSQQASNSQYTQTFGPLEDTIGSANKALGIIKRIKSTGVDNLKSTDTLKTELTNTLGQMYSRGGQITQANTEHARAGLESASGTAAGRLNYIFGGTDNTIASKQLDQLEKEIGATKDELGGVRKSAFYSWLQGMPEEHQTSLQKRFNSFSGSALKSPAKSKSADTSHPQDDPALTWAKAHSDDPRAATILQLQGGAVGGGR